MDDFLSAPLAELDVSVRTYNHCANLGLQTVADIVNAIKIGKLAKFRSMVEELTITLVANGLNVPRPEFSRNIVLLQSELSAIVSERDAAIKATRTAAMERYRPQIEALREQLKMERLEWHRRCDEDQNAVTRHCATCGDELLKATAENAFLVRDTAIRLLIRDGNKQFAKYKNSVGSMAASVSSMRRRLSCCKACKKGRASHSYACDSKIVLDDHSSILRDDSIIEGIA